MRGRGLGWRLPARAGPLLGYFAGRAVVGAALALPLAASVAAVVGPRPGGDAELWQPGGHLLLETVRLLEPRATGLGWSAAVVGLVASFALLAPLAALIASMGAGARSGQLRPRGAGQLGRMAAERFGTLALMMGVVLLLQALLLVLGWAFVEMLLTAAASLQPSTRLLVRLLLVPLGAALPWVLGLVHDVARVVAVQQRLGVLDALAGALSSLRRSFWRAILACGWRGLGAVAALVGSGGLTLAIGCRSESQLAGAVAVQLSALLVASVLRASWFRWVTDELPIAAAVAPMTSR